MKTAAQWRKEFPQGDSYDFDSETETIFNDPDEEWIREIQLDAWKAGMTEALNIVGNMTLPLTCGHAIYSNIRDARDQKSKI